MTDYKTFENKFLYWFNKNNIKHTDKNIKEFYDLTNYLLIENEKYNLTAIKNIDEIIIKHYIDSIIIFKYFDIPEKSKIIDIGTGAGFPALPLSIIREDLNITLLDSSEKKINFIKKAFHDKYIYYCGRAEEFGKDKKIRETYDFAVSRAVAKLNILCEISSPFIKPGGFFISYKSKNANEEISKAENILKILNLQIDKISEFEIENNKRYLIYIKKLKNTPEKYPRNYSDIIKNPI